MTNSIEQVNTLQLSSITADTNYKYRYKWSVRNSNDTLLYVSFNEKDSFLLPKTGVYFVDLLVSNPPYNCSSSYYDTIQVNYNLNITPQYLRSQIKVYPNPAQNTLKIENHSNFSIATIEILDCMGKQVLIQQFSNISRVIDLSGLVHGVYTIRILGNDFNYCSSFIKL
jgi:hypothetical protein